MRPENQVSPWSLVKTFIIKWLPLLRRNSRGILKPFRTAKYFVRVINRMLSQDSWIFISFACCYGLEFVLDQKRETNLANIQLSSPHGWSNQIPKSCLLLMWNSYQWSFIRACSLILMSYYVQCAIFSIFWCLAWLILIFRYRIVPLAGMISSRGTTTNYSTILETSSTGKAFLNWFRYCIFRSLYPLL